MDAPQLKPQKKYGSILKNYATNNKRYSVIYMHDAQNLLIQNLLCRRMECR
jgi:predicted alpha/beta superfamily hydrolase